MLNQTYISGHRPEVVRPYVIAFLYVVSIVFLFAHPHASWAIDAKALFKQTRDSVVLVMSFDVNNQPHTIGSGFFVGDGTLIVTNYHVIEGSSGVKIKQTSGDVVTIDTVAGVDLEHDIVLLKSSSIGKPLKLATRTPEIGEDIVAIGNPKGLEGTLSKGIVSGLRKPKNATYYQITAPISPGSSGGPVISGDGEVLGISTFYLTDGQNLNFAIPSNYISKLPISEKPIPLYAVTENTPFEGKYVNGDIRVIESYIDGSYPSYIEASVLNETSIPINNILILANFYPSQNRGYPVHHTLISIKDVIPPGLALRFKKRDPMLFGHGRDNASKGTWEVEFRVQDFNTAEDNSSEKIILPAAEAFFKTNDIEGTLLLIIGVAKNGNDSPVAFIKLKGVLHDSSAQVVAEKEIYAGNLFSDQELEVLSMDKIEERSLNERGFDNSNYNIPPGGTVRYMIVFNDIPENLTEFTVKVIDSKEIAIYLQSRP